MHIFLNLAYYRYEARQHGQSVPHDSQQPSHGHPHAPEAIRLLRATRRIALVVWLPRGGALVSAQGRLLLLGGHAWVQGGHAWVVL